jgi:hypothetical protein
MSKLAKSISPTFEAATMFDRHRRRKPRARLRLHASLVDARYLNPRLTSLTIISPLDFLGVSANPSC